MLSNDADEKKEQRTRVRIESFDKRKSKKNLPN